MRYVAARSSPISRNVLDPKICSQKMHMHHIRNEAMEHAKGPPSNLIHVWAYARAHVAGLCRGTGQ